MTLGHIVWNDPPGEQTLASLTARVIVSLMAYEAICLAFPSLRLSTVLSPAEGTPQRQPSPPLMTEHRFPRR
ncbi:MAG: hypothetical protein ACRDHF_04685 [Tepidiformaceae bacterium]